MLRMLSEGRNLRSSHSPYLRACATLGSHCPLGILDASRQLSTCGVKVERVPWATGKQRMTDDFRHFLSTWARRVTWSEVALYFRTSWNTVYRAVRSTVEWGLENRVLSEVTAVGVDEIHIRKGHNYMTLVYQLDEGARRLLAIRPGREGKALVQCLRDIGQAARKSIRYVCSDM